MTYLPPELLAVERRVVWLLLKPCPALLLHRADLERYDDFYCGKMRLMPVEHSR